jgi:hypothetical protein
MRYLLISIDPKEPSSKLSQTSIAPSPKVIRFASIAYWKYAPDAPKFEIIGNHLTALKV